MIIFYENIFSNLNRFLQIVDNIIYICISSARILTTNICYISSVTYDGWLFKGFLIDMKLLTSTISAILWWSVLLLEETGIPGENHRPVASH
jgi:hypothetical protein